MGARPAAAAPVGPLGPVGPETITVDGDPSDWTGTAPTVVNTAAASNGEFIWNDTTGDDTGNGSYTYPTNSAFNPGLFDITQIRITADANNLYLLIRVNNLTNPWGGGDGFSTVAGVLLIDTTLNTAGQLTARPNVNITAGQGWEYYVKIGQSGWQAENSKIFDTAGNWAPIVNKGNSAFDSIEVSVPLAFIGKDGYDINGATWGFMLFLQSHAGENPDGFRSVTAAGGEYAFGGCDSSVYMCPEIQDIAFSATKTAQEAELNTFGTDHPATMSSSAQVTFASVGFVPDTTPPEITNIAAAPTFNQADISWETNELANTTVWYGTTPTPTTKRSVAEFVTHHLVTLSGLDPTTTYYYKVESWDVAGNRNVSAVGSFTTRALPPANIASWNGNTFVWEDTRGDDTGDGNYVYPMESSVRWQGRGDLWYVNMTGEGNWLHVNVRINAKPETDWRERMAAFALFIDQDHIPGSGARDVSFVQPESAPGHPMNLSVSADFAWEYMVLATFQNETELATPGAYNGEMIIRNSTFEPAFGTYGLVYMSTNPSASPEPNAGIVASTLGGTQLDLWLNRSVIGTTDNWTYVAAGLMYDDAGGGWPNGGIRQVRPSAANWEGGGSNGPMNPNVYDLAFYPDTASQQTDLSSYSSSAHVNLTRAMQVNFTAKWNMMLAVPGISATVSVDRLHAGESAGLVAFVTKGASPVAGAPVTLTATPAGAVDILTPNPATANSFGAAMFTVRAAQVATDVVVTLNATATVGGVEVTSLSLLQVSAYVISHNYRAFASAADGVLSTGGQTTISVVFTDKGAPIQGASVGLASGSGVVTVGTTPATTDSNGRATFTISAGYTESDVTATLTATATNGTATASATVSITVKAFVHVYSMSGTSSKAVVAANDTTTVTFTFVDAGHARAGVQVAITLTPTTAFDVVGDVSKTTDASGVATFTLRAKALADDTAVVVAASATNGTATATASVTVVAQGLPPSTTGPVTQGVAMEAFVAVAVVLAVIAAAFAVLWMRARASKPREEGPGKT